MNYLILLLFVLITMNLIKTIKTKSKRRYIDVRDGVRYYGHLIHYLLYFTLGAFFYLSNHSSSNIIEAESINDVYLFGTFFVSSLVLVVLIISVIAIIIIIKYSHKKKVFIAVMFFSTVTISLTIFDALLKIDEFKLYEKNNIEHQEFNLFSQGNNSSVEEVTEILEVSVIDGFESGSYIIPKFNWKNLETKISNKKPKIIIISGFSDPHRTKKHSEKSNEIIASKRALAVRYEILKMNFIKGRNIPVYIMSNGVKNGVKLFQYQIDDYSIERKVKIYVGV